MNMFNSFVNFVFTKPDDAIIVHHKSNGNASFEVCAVGDFTEHIHVSRTNALHIMSKMIDGEEQYSSTEPLCIEWLKAINLPSVCGTLCTTDNSPTTYGELKSLIQKHHPTLVGICTN